MAFSATGGNKTTADDYIVHVFTTSGSLVCTESMGPTGVEVLVIGGGGGGSSGGGGAGGYLTGTETLTGTMTVTVGTGGAGTQADGSGSKGGSGGDSVFGTRTAKGGGGGGRVLLGDCDGVDGGSGGGGAANGSQITQPGSATGSPTSQGHDGGHGGLGFPYPAGGGGGAATAGQDNVSTTESGDGGAGYDNDIVLAGTNVGYAGGGGGGFYTTGYTAGHATHGGGAGGHASGVSGTANTGGGGGGAGQLHNGGAGGDGIVVVRYHLTTRQENAAATVTVTAVATVGIVHFVATESGAAGFAFTASAFMDAIGLSGAAEVTLTGTATGGLVVVESGAATFALGATAAMLHHEELDLAATGLVSLDMHALMTPQWRWIAPGLLTLGGGAYLTPRAHGADTFVARGFIHTGSRARLTYVGESLPATDELGWTAADATPPDLLGLTVVAAGTRVKPAAITALTIELDTEGGPKAATMSVAHDLVRQPHLGDAILVRYKSQTLFRGRLENIATDIGDSTGYTLTYAGPMVTLRDHKAFRTVYVDSDLANWRTDQGPRTSPDTFEVASRTSGNT